MDIIIEGKKLAKKKGMPEWGELVLCTVTRLTPYAAWCRMDEYPDLEGMIHIAEVVGKWVRDIRKFVKEGKQYVAKVIKIDYQKKHVNLSLKRVSKYEKREKMNKFKRTQRAEKMLEHAAKDLGKTLDEAYEEIGFLLQDQFGELFTAFEEAWESKDVLAKAGVPEKWAEALMKIIEKTFKEKETVIRVELELKTYANDGIEKIKDALKDLKKNIGVEIKYISAPKYRIELKTTDPKEDERRLTVELELAVKRIKQADGEGSFRFIR